MRLPSRRQILKGAVALPVPAVLLAGCAPRFEPLSPYNDSWEGEITFEHQPPRKLTAELLVTGVQERHAAEHNVEQRGFADVTIGDLRLAAHLHANHWDMRPNVGHYSGIEGREFVQLELEPTVFPREGDDMKAEAVVAYGARYQQLLASIGLADLTRFATPSRDLVALWGERKGPLIEGTVVIRFPDGPSGRRDVARGTFRLTRVGGSPATRVSDQIIETEAFVFELIERRDHDSIVHSSRIRVK